MNPKTQLPTSLGVQLCCLLLLCCGFCPPSKAHAIDIGLNQSPSIAIVPYALYWHDKSGTLPYQDIQSKLGEFSHKQTEVLNIGYSTGAHWLNFTLSNSSPQPQHRIIEFSYTLTDELTLYYQQDGQLHELQQGRIYRAQQEERNRVYSFPITLAPDESIDFSLRVASEDAVVIPLWLMTDAEYYQSLNTTQQLLSYYFGLVTAIAVFGIFLWLFLKEKVYRYYALGVIAHHGLFFIILNGLSPSVLGFTSVWWSREALTVFISLSLLLFIQFGRAFFNTAVTHPKIHRFLNFNIAASVICLCLAFVLSHHQAISIASVAAAINGSIMIFTGIKALKTSPISARFYLASWCLAIVGGIFYSLKTWGIVPSNVFTEHAWQAGTAIESLLLSLAITSRIGDEAKLKEQAQKEILTLQQQANESLERRVQERTQELEQLNHKLEELSDTDQLTGLKNRRYLDRLLPIEVERCAQQKKSIALLIMDIDHFKNFNDSYGHLAGDSCLQAVAQCIEKELHWPNDRPVRYGGEEFCIFLPDTKAEGARAVAERIRENVAGLNLTINDKPVPVTLSIGIVGLVPDGKESIASIINKADEALYAAKISGRNRTIIYNKEAMVAFSLSRAK